jgi:hypothetical protein
MLLYADAETVSYKLESLPASTTKDRVKLKALAARPSSEIDTSELPEWTSAQWKTAVRGKFYRPKNIEPFSARCARSS